MRGNNVADGAHKRHNDGKRHFEPDTANVAGNGEKCFIRRITFREAVDVTGGERRKRHNDNKQYRRQN
ncbi:Uncharacterised protein [Acinetobacter baumannii]|nr:Uncharacterised protein [Acinetobacter baumannii]